MVYKNIAFKFLNFLNLRKSNFFFIDLCKLIKKRKNGDLFESKFFFDFPNKNIIKNLKNMIKFLNFLNFLNFLK